MIEVPNLSFFVPQESCWMDSGDLSHPILWILSKMRRSPLSNKETH